MQRDSITGALYILTQRTARVTDSQLQEVTIKGTRQARQRAGTFETIMKRCNDTGRHGLQKVGLLIRPSAGLKVLKQRTIKFVAVPATGESYER